MAKDVEKAEVLSDNELVERCLKGDGEAWELLISRYQRLVYSVARTLCSDPDDAADVFQNTCLDLYKGLPVLRDVKALPAWLMTVTRRRSIGVLKAKMPQSDAEEELTAVSDVLSSIEREHSIERAIEQLPDRCRHLIDLLYFNNTEPTYVEISERLGIPVASIGPTRARCLDKLKKILS